MTTLPDTIVLPLLRDADGVLRVGKTRVMLDSVVSAFQEGLTAEEIAQQYPSVALANLYEILGFYLRHQTELDRELTDQRAKNQQQRSVYEAQHDPVGIRQRLLARRATGAG
jgi:uncharacterized protein (DUF433 family)